MYVFSNDNYYSNGSLSDSSFFIILLLRFAYAQQTSSTSGPNITATSWFPNSTWTTISSSSSVASNATVSDLPFEMDNATIQSNNTQQTALSSDSDDQENLPDVSNVHFHLTVPRYYTPYEEIPFLYFVDASDANFTNQRKYYFTMHMGSSPYSPTYGLFLLNLTVGTYMFHIGRAFNRTW